MGNTLFGRRRQGAALMELVTASLLTSILALGVGMLYTVGYRTHQTAYLYSETQTYGREALRKITRAARHGYAVMASGASGTLSGQASGANQMIVRMPEPSEGSADSVEARFHLSGGTLYYQRSDQSSPGTTIGSYVTALTFRYFTSDGTEVAADPETATRVEIALTVTRSGISTTTRALVTLRNAGANPISSS
jgi:Tfp pilus assembly protein PilW